MIRLNLQTFAKSASYMKAYRQSIRMAKGDLSATDSGSSGGGGENRSSQPSSKQEDIVDSRGYVREIVAGYKYNLYQASGNKNELWVDNLSASETNEYLEGFAYDEATSTFRDRDGRTFRVKIVKRK